jgi:hypothetical protein
MKFSLRISVAPAYYFNIYISQQDTSSLSGRVSGSLEFSSIFMRTHNLQEKQKAIFHKIALLRQLEALGPLNVIASTTFLESVDFMNTTRRNNRSKAPPVS